MPKVTKEALIKRKDLMIKALDKKLGNIALACQEVGIARSTYYDWMKNDPEFEARVRDTKETCIDFVESSLLNQIKNGNTSATIFYLKCMAGHRGYVENQVIHSYNQNLNVDMTPEEKQAIIDKVKQAESEFDDYE